MISYFANAADRATPLKSVAPYQVDKMSYNNNNSSNVAIPVGFRFHPTDEELVGWYLHNRVTAPPPEPREDDQRIIRELDLYKHEPWDLAGEQILLHDIKLYFLISRVQYLSSLYLYGKCKGNLQ